MSMDASDPSCGSPCAAAEDETDAGIEILRREILRVESCIERLQAQARDLQARLFDITMKRNTTVRGIVSQYRQRVSSALRSDPRAQPWTSASQRWRACSIVSAKEWAVGELRRHGHRVPDWLEPTAQELDERWS
jgi:hypothetical protein